MDARPEALTRFLQPYPPEVQAVALEGRAFLLDLLEPASEIHWDACAAVCAGFTFTASTNDNFVNLAVYSDHVTLILPWGVRHEDPEGRLKGNGTRIRHIRLKGTDTLRDPYVVGQILQAQALAKRPPEPREPETIVKVMNGPKRRPKPASVTS